MERENDGEWRKTTAMSLRIVDTIEELDGATLSEIANHMSISSSTLYTHLNTLEEFGYVTKAGDEYHLGLKIFHLGEIARYRDDRYRLAKEKAFELADVTNEEVNFAVEENGRSIILFDETDNPASEGYQVGRYFYMHNSASGKAMLAEFDEERREAILDRWGLPQETENTIVDRDELRTELVRTRERGYAVNDQEALEGLRSVAVPVDDPGGGVFGSLDVSGPPYRLPPDEELAELLQDAVDELETSIATK